MKISLNFELEEFTNSSTAKAKKISNIPGFEEIENLKYLCKYILEPIRSHFQKPITITSGYRCPDLEKIISGVTSKDRSQHMQGLAADFVIAGVPIKEIFVWVMNSGLPYDQLIFEKFGKSEWIHISYGRRRMALLGIDTNNDNIMEYVHVNPTTYS